MLERLRVKNFKLLRDVDIVFPGDAPTVFIGPNASGKSTVVEVLDFLGRCATDGLEAAVVAHGGMRAIRTAGAMEPIEISSDWRLVAEDGKDRALRWALAIDAGETGQVVIRSEHLEDDDRVLVSTSDDGRRRAVDETTSKEPDGPKASPSRKEPPPRKDPFKVGTLLFQALVDERRHPGLYGLRAMLAEIRVLGAVAATPPWARAQADRSSPRDALVVSTQAYVGREGMGLANALYNLQVHHADAWTRLERAFRAEFPFIKRIVFPADPGGSRIAFAAEDERFAGRLVYASELSDGMVVYLCLLALILHPGQAAALALDEPDAHLHPSALRRLMALAHQGPARRTLIIVTHSNALLDELRDPAGSIRIVEATTNGARIRKLDPEALKAWREDYTLSDLRSTGLLDPSNSAYGNDE